ncbi:MAG: DUF3466 family protein [Pseudomonadota bacterium]
MKNAIFVITTLALAAFSSPGAAATFTTEGYTVDILTSLALNQPRAINDHGQVTGRAASRGFFSPYLYDPDAGTVFIRDETGENLIEGVDINNDGTVVGVAPSFTESFQWSAEDGYQKVTDTIDLLSGPREISTRLTAINNNGTAVGTTSLIRSGPNTRIEVWQDGEIVDRSFDLTALGGPDNVFSMFPFDINDHGQILGFAQSTTTGVARGIWDVDGSFTALEIPDGFLSVAPTAINNKGQVVGLAQRLSATGESEGLPYFWDPINGASVFIDSMPTNPDGSIFTPTIGGINDFGQFVGSIAYDLEDGSRRFTGALWESDGTLLELDTLFEDQSLWLFNAIDINNKGQILGRMSTRSPLQFFNGGYVLTPDVAPGVTPVPLPASASMLLAGTVLLGWAGGRRRVNREGRRQRVTGSIPEL